MVVSGRLVARRHASSPSTASAAAPVRPYRCEGFQHRRRRQKPGDNGRCWPAARAATGPRQAGRGGRAASTERSRVSGCPWWLAWCRSRAVAVPEPCRGRAGAVPEPCRGRAGAMPWPCWSRAGARGIVHHHVTPLSWPPLGGRWGAGG